MTIRITAELVAMGRSARGGWTKAQLELLGVTWPPDKGWKERVIGVEIGVAIMKRFIDLARSDDETIEEFLERSYSETCGPTEALVNAFNWYRETCMAIDLGLVPETISERIQRLKREIQERQIELARLVGGAPAEGQRFGPREA